jgi:hypothetical protein
MAFFFLLRQARRDALRIVLTLSLSKGEGGE